MASNVREARRRKIMERGSDRLALITGQIQSLPSSSSHEEIKTDSDNPSSQPLISHTAAGTLSLSLPLSQFEPLGLFYFARMF